MIMLKTFQNYSLEPFSQAVDQLQTVQNRILSAFHFSYGLKLSQLVLQLHANINTII